MRKPQIVILLISFLACVSCTNSNVKQLIKQRQDYLNHKEWYVSDVSATIYTFVEKDYFTDKDLLRRAISYSSTLADARYNEDLAEKYLRSLEPEYRYNPNKWEISKEKQAHAEFLKESAAKQKEMLKEMVADPKIDPNNQGIWVIHSFSHKEYISRRTWTRPIYECFLYRLTPNGKKIIEDKIIPSRLFKDFYEATGKEYKAIKVGL